MDEGSKTLASMPFPSRSGPAALTAPAANLQQQQEQNKEKEKALGNIWDAARQACQERIAEYVMNEEGDSFTAEEHELGIEHVRTGLQRSFDDEYEDDDEDDEDEMDVDGGRGRGGGGGGGGGGPDLMIIDRPPPPPAPAVSTQEVEGATPETILRLATRGLLTT
jgi:mediator of RNA polymerase II transcription subunit 8, fungi type